MSTPSSRPRTRARRVPFSLLILPLLAASGCALGGAPMSSSDATLEGTTWHFVDIHGETPPEDMDAHPHLRVESSTGQVVGDTGCNAFNGPYRADGARLVMGPLAVTRRACPEDIAAFEDHVLEAIRSTTLYRIRGSRLFLYTDSESMAHATLEAAE